MPFILVVPAEKPKIVLDYVENWLTEGAGFVKKSDLENEEDVLNEREDGKEDVLVNSQNHNLSKIKAV